MLHTCVLCNGTGVHNNKPCEECEGKGELEECQCNAYEWSECMCGAWDDEFYSDWDDDDWDE